MKVILSEDVVGLGDIGETVTVRPGYARNFLVPRGLAFEAGAVSARQLAHRSKQIEAKRKKFKGAAQEKATSLGNTTVQVFLRVGTGGKVFGAITSRDIAEKLKEQGFDIDRRRVLLGEPIKKPGSFFVEVKLHPEVKIQIRIDVEARAASGEEEEMEVEEARAQLERGKRVKAVDKAEDKAEDVSAEQSKDEAAA